MNKRAQVTVFIILGVVIFTIIGLLFYVKNYVKTKEFTEEKQESIDMLTTMGKYASYMQACLDQTAKQAVALVGMQGGVIYDYQANDTKQFLGPKKYDYGQYVLPFEYDTKTNLYDGSETIFNVSYGIYAPDLSLRIEGHPTVPEYPYGTTPLVADPETIDYTHPFGNIITSPLPPLCDYHGNNTPGQAGAVFSCETYDSKRENDDENIQEFLEAYILQSFKECVSLESLPEFANSSITTGNVTVDVTFAPTSVTIDAAYPVVGEVSGKTATLAMEKFHTTINVRLKQMHELAVRLIEEDINNIFFNIVRDANELADCKEPGKETFLTTCLKEGMEVTKYRDVCKTLGKCKEYGQYDDIIVIQDKKFMLTGKPYIFAFAIQNRYPALDLIRDDATATSTYDFVVTEGQPIKIDPKGYDPDEDNHGDHDWMDSRYIYGLWKEDYDEAPVSVITSIGPADVRFTTSTEYDGRYATYTTDGTTGTDRGPHTLQVQVCDNQGLCDFQNIEICVEDATTPSYC